MPMEKYIPVAHNISKVSISKVSNRLHIYTYYITYNITYIMYNIIM